MKKLFVKIAIFILILLIPMKVYAEEIKNDVEKMGYYYFDSEEEAYNFAKDFVDKLPNNSIMLSDNIIKIAYSGNISNRINNLAYNDIDNFGIGYYGNRIFESVKESSTQIIIQEINDDFLKQNNLVGYQISNIWRTNYKKNERLTKEQFYESFDIASQLAYEFNYGSDYEKARRVYEYICNNMEYDYTYTNASMYSALKNNKSICTGFAESFFQICSNMGLEVYIIQSNTHVYNIIKLEDSYYIADPTQDLGLSSNYKGMFIGTNNNFYKENIDRFGDNSEIGIKISSLDYEYVSYYQNTEKINTDDIEETINNEIENDTETKIEIKENKQRNEKTLNKK